MNRRLILTTVLMTLLPAAAGAQSADQDEEYLRLAKDDYGQPVSLQVPIISFEPADGNPEGLRVDLVGAIHVGDESYFETLNQRFTGYDSVLYELVAPEGARPVPDMGPTNLISGMQLGITRMLELSFQLNEIDYTAPNFVHADLTPEAMAASMDERGESTLTYLARLFSASMSDSALQAEAMASGPIMLMSLFTPDRARVLKTLMATTMLDVEAFSAIIEGDNGSTMVSDRNARAVEVLEDRIGVGDRRLAIFYGVAHLPDLAERLISDFGLIRSGVSWIDAWDLRPTTTN